MSQSTPNYADQPFKGSSTVKKVSMPTSQQAVSVLTRLLDKDNAVLLWGRICREAGTTTDCSDPAKLKLIFQKLSKEPGAAGVLGRSLSVQLLAYQEVSR